MLTQEPETKGVGLEAAWILHVIQEKGTGGADSEWNMEGGKDSEIPRYLLDVFTSVKREDQWH